MSFWRPAFRSAPTIVALAAVLMVPGVVSAQSGQSSESEAAQASDDGQESSQTNKMKQKKQGEQSDGESAEDNYAWKPSQGIGFEYGQFYSPLDRWDSYLLNPNGAATIDTPMLHSFQIAGEISPIPRARFTAFAGLETPFSSSTTLYSFYGGLEPTYAVRRGDWAIGLGAAFAAGYIQLNSDPGAFSTGIFTLRPHLEVRHYLNESTAVYADIGFKQWLPFAPDTSELDISDPTEDLDRDVRDLYEGSVQASIGFRWGYYPEHVKEDSAADAGSSADSEGDTE